MLLLDAVGPYYYNYRKEDVTFFGILHELQFKNTLKIFQAP